MASINRIPLGLAYASTQVNATVFRVSAVVTAGQFQYATYYDPTGAIVVAQRKLNSERWDAATLPVNANVKDAHNDVVLGVSADGILHLSYDHHAQSLHYRKSARPHDIRSFGEAIPMTGRTEAHVTYPQFVSAPDGTLYFFYRDGASGNGNLCLNRYDAGAGGALESPAPSARRWSGSVQPLLVASVRRSRRRFAPGLVLARLRRRAHQP